MSNNQLNFSADLFYPINLSNFPNRVIDRASTFDETNAVSNEYYDIKKQITTFFLHLWETNLNEDKLLYNEARNIFNNCTYDGWDGYKAKKISPTILINTLKFINKIPSYIPKPELVPEPTGEIGMSWEKYDNSLDISIDDNAIISFGILKNDNSTIYGSLPFKDEIPKRLINEIINIYARD